MIYLKSVLAGLFTLLIAIIALPVLAVAGLAAYSMLHRSQGEDAIGWDPISLVRMNPMIWLFAALVFFAGFVWEYRRLAK